MSAVWNASSQYCALMVTISSCSLEISAGALSCGVWGATLSDRTLCDPAPPDRTPSGTTLGHRRTGLRKTEANNESKQASSPCEPLPSTGQLLDPAVLEGALAIATADTAEWDTRQWNSQTVELGTEGSRDRQRTGTAGRSVVRRCVLTTQGAARTMASSPRGCSRAAQRRSECSVSRMVCT